MLLLSAKDAPVLLRFQKLSPLSNARAAAETSNEVRVSSYRGQKRGQRSNRKGMIRSRCAYLRLVRVTADDTIATGCDPTACCLAIESFNEAMKIDPNYRGTFVRKPGRSRSRTRCTRSVYDCSLIVTTSRYVPLDLTTTHRSNARLPLQRDGKETIVRRKESSRPVEARGHYLRHRSA